MNQLRNLNKSNSIILEVDDKIVAGDGQLFNKWIRLLPSSRLLVFSDRIDRLARQQRLGWLRRVTSQVRREITAWMINQSNFHTVLTSCLYKHCKDIHRPVVYVDTFPPLLLLLTEWSMTVEGYTAHHSTFPSALEKSMDYLDLSPSGSGLTSNTSKSTAPVAVALNEESPLRAVTLGATFKRHLPV